MATTLDLKDNIAAINMQVEAKSAIGRTAKVYADLNREQLSEGRRADMTMMPDYSWVSVHFYGKPEGPIRLFDTGAFHESLNVDVGSDTIEVLSQDRYNLEERYGEEIYGLADPNQEYYNQEVFLPELCESLESLTGLAIL